MAKEEVIARTQEGAQVTFEYDFGDTLDDMVANFGEGIITAHCKRSLVVAAQGHARNLMRQEKSPGDIKNAMATWKPGTPRIAKTKGERLSEIMDQMSPEERDAFIKELKATSKKAT